MTVPAGNGPDGRAATCTKVRNSNPSGVRESNRVSNWLFRMVALLAVLLNGSTVHAAQIKLMEVIPSDKSEISSFDIKLKFDISEAIAELGNDNIGIGYTGTTRGVSTYLYEGTEESGKLISNVLTANFKGSSEYKDCVVFPFPQDLIPVPGQVYTLVCKNQFRLYDLSTSAIVSAVPSIQYNKEPLVLTFTGKAASADELVFQKASITDNEILNSISSVSFEFNESIIINSNKEASIYNGTELIASTAEYEIDEANDKVLNVKFKETPLYRGNSYSVRLPEGIVSLKGNSNILNKAVEFLAIGDSTIRVSTNSASIENDAIGMPSKAVIKFNLEEGQTLTPPEGIQHERGIDFYKDDVADTNFITTLLGTTSGESISWDLSTFQFEPETKYILRKKADDITVWVNGKHQPAYGNEEVVISFTTPSVAEAGYPEMEFGALQYLVSSGAEYIDYSENATVSKLLEIQIPLKDKFYYLNSKKYNLCINTNLNSNECKIYEVTPTGDKYLSSSRISILSASDAISDFKIGYSNINTALYEGKLYKIVIPENCFSAYPAGTSPNVNPMMNYIGNKEMTYLFKGATPAKAVLLGCNVSDNSVRASLHNIVWTFDGEYRLKDETATIEYSSVSKEGFKSGVTKVPVYVSNFSGKTALSVDFVNKSTGEPKKLINGTTYTFVMPAGILVNVLNDEIINDELVLTVKGGEDTSVAQKINVNLTVNGLHTASHSAIKGERYSLALKPVENWTVESVRHGDKELASENGVYTTEPLNEDADITATLAYDGPWAVEHETTGVWEIADSNVKIYSEESHIVVAGAQPGNKIAVYTAAGLLVGEARGKEEADLVRISVAPGQVYIVTVDGTAAKLQM